MVSEGGHWPPMCYFVWLLMPWQGQKIAVTKNLEFGIIIPPTTWRGMLSTSVSRSERNQPILL